MGVQLNIKDAETVRLARALAERTGKSVTETIRQALLDEQARQEAASAARLARLDALIKETHARMTPEMRLITSKEAQDSLYDDGIPT